MDSPLNRKKRPFPFPLRFSIPLMLLLFGGGVSLFSFWREVALSNLRTEKQIVRQVRFSGDQISGTLEYLLRKSDVEGANLVISKLGGDLTLQLAVLCDENNTILLSTRYELRNHWVSQTTVADLLPKFTQIRQKLAGQVVLTKDGKTIRALYPVVLGAKPGEIRPTKVGILLMEYDIDTLKRLAISDALKRSLESTFVLGIFCAIMWVFFNKTLTERAVQLVKASNRLAQGTLGVRTRLQGTDEIAQISGAFDQMAQQIQMDQQALQKLVERRELLNHLASQIRNSLELETVLSTAVQEIRDLFDIDRCKFLWCQIEDGVPQFKLSYAACGPLLTEALSYYPIQEVANFGHRLLQPEILRIDDIAEDQQFDPETKQILLAHGFTSLLCAPLYTRSQRIGLILCEHFHQVRSWSDDEVELLQSVADQVAIAIDQAELYEQRCNAAETAAFQAEQLQHTLENLRQAQTKLIQTEKMSSLGQLVAGVAHEINNPVSFIYGNIDHTREYIQDLLALIDLYQEHYPVPQINIQNKIESMDLDFVTEDLPKMLTSMRIGAERIREIVLTLRNFSRLDEAEKKPVSIHEGIDSTLLILQHRLKVKPPYPEIQVIREYGDLPKVECYVGQLNQVFMNIIGNAIDALESYSIRRMKEGQPVDPLSIRIRTEMVGSDRVVVRIADNGSGMTEQTRARLFDPFFTTKPIGKGTGLGLSISYQIVVEKHGGVLRCESQIGAGSEFIIEIPICQNLKLPTQNLLVA